MWSKIVAFFMTIIAFFTSLFGGGIKKDDNYLKNVKYGAHERQVVDIAFPQDASGDVGLALFIHGGAWIAGDKSVYDDNVKNAAPALGFVGATMNYRYLSDKVSMDDILDDITAALGVIKEKAAERGINITKVLLTGHSAGAHLSLLYAYSRKAEAPIEPVAVVSYCGPTDLASRAYIDELPKETYDILGPIFGYITHSALDEQTYSLEENQAKLRAASPVYYVNKTTVPTVICHGMKDTVVPYSNAVELDEILTQYAVEHEFVTYPNSNHGLESDPEQAKIGGNLLVEYANRYLK